MPGEPTHFSGLYNLSQVLSQPQPVTLTRSLLLSPAARYSHLIPHWFRNHLPRGILSILAVIAVRHPREWVANGEPLERRHAGRHEELCEGGKVMAAIRLRRNVKVAGLKKKSKDISHPIDFYAALNNIADS